MNFEKWNEKHQNQTEKDVNNYLRIFDELLKIIVLYVSLETLKKGLFSFGIYPVLNRKINVLFEQFHRKSASKLDFYIDKHYRFSQKKFTGIFNEKTNQKWTSDFLKKDKKRLLSERVWKLNAQFRQEIEMALDVAIADGVSASQLATHLKQYLKNPDALFRRYRDKNGVLQLSKNALAYHTGRGVYRSAYKNAERLARTEINIAYRSADIERWQGLDFIAGYQIKRSRNLSPCPICDMMAGVYPKSFVWVGNHPNCRCYMVPIFKADIGNKPLIINPKLTQWLSKNADNIPKNKPMFLWGADKLQKREVYKKIFTQERSKQFIILQEYKNGGKVLEHKLTKKGDDYQDIIKVAHAFAKQGKLVEIMPEIYKNERTIRDVIFPNLQSKTSNPDLRIGNKYYDVKRPSAIKNILGNANKSSSQGAIAVISTNRLDKELTEQIAKERAKDIFGSKKYKFSQVYFLYDDNIKEYNRTGGR